MSDAKKCDRCGAFYISSRKARKVYELYPNSSTYTKNGLDMCPECAAKFDKWWNKKQKSDAQ